MNISNFLFLATLVLASSVLAIPGKGEFLTIFRIKIPCPNLQLLNRHSSIQARIQGCWQILKINSLDAISWHLTTRSSIYKNSRRREMIRGQFFFVGEK
jgi:hypothetical protein